MARKKGSFNKFSRSVAEMCAEKGFDPFDVLMAFASDPKSEWQFAAAKELCSYIKPKAQAIQISTPDGQPLQANVQIKAETFDRISKLADAILNEGKTSGAI